MRFRTLAYGGAIVLCVVAALICAGVWVTFRAPGPYRAKSVLAVRGGRVIFHDLKVRRGESSLETHAQLIRSHFVLNGALAQPEVADLPWIRSLEDRGKDPVEWLSDRIEFDINDELITISMAGDDPVQLQIMVKAVTKAYLDRVVNEERKNLLKRRDLLEQLYHRKSEEIRKRREDIRGLSRRAGTPTEETVAQRTLLEDYVNDLRAEVLSRKRKIRETQFAIRRLRSTAASAERDKKVAELEVELSNLKEDYRELESQFVLVYSESEKLGGYSADLERRQEDLEHVIAVTRDIGLELERLQTELEVGGKRIVLIEEARLPR